MVERSRRFAIGAALAVMALASGAVSIQRSDDLVWGVLRIQLRPEHLEFVVLAMAAYAVLRFGFYGVMLGPSPARERRAFIGPARTSTEPPLTRVRALFGTRTEQLTIPFLAEGRESQTAALATGQRDLAAELTRMFPRFGRKIARIGATIAQRGGGWTAQLLIPWPCRVAARFQDLDYTLPIWLNSIALTWWCWPG